MFPETRTSGRGRAARTARALLAVGIVLLVFGLARVLPGPVSPQSRSNLAFAAKASVQKALDAYPKFWPPLYPSVLWLARRAGVAPADVDRALFCMTLLLLAIIVSRHLPGIDPVYPVLLVAVADFNHHNLREAVSEHLVVPLALLLFLLVLRTHAQRGRAHVVAMAVTGAALGLTKYFSPFWPLPLAGLRLMTVKGAPMRRRLAHTAVFLATALVPVALWMLYAWHETGFLTGMDRRAPRLGRQGTTLYWNVVFVLRTLVLDLFSPETSATRTAVFVDGRPSAAEVVLLLLGGAAIVASVWTESRRRGEMAPGGRAAETLPWLIAFTVTYLVALVTLWTLGNNDPIYTRFLYPLYPFVILLAFAVYRRIRERGVSVLVRLPWWGLYAGVLGVQCRRVLGEAWPRW